MGSSKDVIQHIRDEDNDAYSDDSLFNIKPWGADLSFRELIQRYEDEELVKPELQRMYVWDRAEASRFIDSLLLGLPVPSIFLAQTQDEKLLIIDAEQRRVRNTTIHAIIFSQQQPGDEDTSLFQVFERINTSGRTLLPQEIRNCAAQGTFNSLLFSLNKYGPWRELFGLSDPDSRMRDMEYILRFFALTSDAYLADVREKISLRRFLDLYMKANSNAGLSQINEFRERFTAAIDLVMESFGANAFHNISPTDSEKFVPKFSPTIFDSTLIAADLAIRIGGIQIPADARQARRALLLNPQYKLAISQETMKRDSIKTRVSLASRHLFGVEYEQ